MAHKTRLFKDYAENPTLEELIEDREVLWNGYYEAQKEIRELEVLVDELILEINDIKSILPDMLEDIRGIETMVREKREEFFANTGLYIVSNNLNIDVQKATHLEIVKIALLKGQLVNSKVFTKFTGLSSIIKKLRSMGFPIIQEKVDGGKLLNYSLPKNWIQKK